MLYQIAISTYLPYNVNYVFHCYLPVIQRDIRYPYIVIRYANIVGIVV